MDDAHSELLSTFVAITDCELDVAQQYLQSHDWNMDSAVNTFFATGGAARPSTGAAEPGGGLADGGLDADWVREPIPAKMDKLFDSYRPVASAEAGRGTQRPVGRRDGGGLAAEQPPSHAKEAFRDFQQEAQQEANALRAADAADDGSTASKKPKNLADIYRPPIELCFRGTFEALRAAGCEQGKWLLVNIQSPVEFASQQLNADTWRDEVLRAVIGAHFLFWQQYHDSPAGDQYVRHYLRPDAGGGSQLPHIGLLDPRTGELCKSFSGFVSAERLLDLLVRYADTDLKPTPAVGLHPSESVGGEGGVGGGGGLWRSSRVQSQPTDRATTGLANPSPSPNPMPLEPHTPADDDSMPQFEADPAADDAFWAEHAPGPEPESMAEGTVQLVVKLPGGGTRTPPRKFATTSTLGEVLSWLHTSCVRLDSARSWALVQAMPRVALAVLSEPLSTVARSGMVLLILQESA